MLKELKFVQGAVAKKDLVAAMTHFRIKDGNVRAYNGVLALNSPIPLDIDCVPRAEMMVKAIGQCKEAVTLGLTDTWRLRIQSGPFKAFIDCLEEEAGITIEPSGDRADVDGAALLAAVKALEPFIGNDAARPWANGILLRDKSAFATNNVVLCEYWLGVETPHVVNIPAVAVREMIRVGEPPEYLQIDEHSVTFHYADGRWIRTQLLDTTWPDISKILNTESNPQPVDKRLFEGLAMLNSFLDKQGRVYLEGDSMRTQSMDAECGASFTAEGLGITGIYQINMLSLLDGVAQTADFSLYPKPVMFFGGSMRGAIIGMRP